MTPTELTTILSSVDMTPIWLVGVLVFALHTLEWFVNVIRDGFRAS